jgi:hypothetical protein
MVWCIYKYVGPTGLPRLVSNWRFWFLESFMGFGEWGYVGG